MKAKKLSELYNKDIEVIIFDKEKQKLIEYRSDKIFSR